MLKFGRLAAVGIFSFMWFSPADADFVPDKGTWEHYHFSLDQSRIRVSLINDVVGKADFPDLLVPRAYVLFVSGAPPSTAGPLPPLLMSDHVKLLFIDGTGEPWSVAVTDLARRERISLTEAAKRIRAEEINLTIHSSKDPEASSKIVESLKGRTFLVPEGAFEGLPQHKTNSSSYPYFIGQANDEFFYANCRGPDTHPIFFCKYWMNLTEGVVAEAMFVDFRLHGGREFANRRLRFAREVACRFLTRC